MAKGRRFQVGIGLIVAGIALIALNVWLFTALHLVPDRRGGYAALGVIGLAMLASGVMVLLGA